MHKERPNFKELVHQIGPQESRSYVLAELTDYLESLSPEEFTLAVSEAPSLPEDAVWANVVAAMVETAAYRKNSHRPKWVSDLAPLEDPWFATELKSLRLYLLCVSPPAFKRRNLFVDSTLGDRV